MKVSSGSLFFLLVVLSGCIENSSIKHKTVPFNGIYKEGHFTYLNNNNQPCLEGNTNKSVKVGKWSMFNCRSEKTATINFYDEDVYYVTYYASGSGDAMFRYGVKGDSVMNVFCADYYGELTIDCTEKAKKKHSLNFEMACSCEE